MACWDWWAGEERGRNGQVDKWATESGEGKKEKRGEGGNACRMLCVIMQTFLFCHVVNS